MNPLDVKNYKHIDFAVWRLDKKIDDLREQNVIADKVRGSDSCFPYEPRGFSISSETHGKAIQKLEKEKSDLLRLKAQIKAVPSMLEDPISIFIFEQSMNGKSQTEIAAMLDIVPSTVSRHLQRICEHFS